MNYQHTQKAPLYLLLCGVAILLLVAAWFARSAPGPIAILLVAVAAILVVFASAFRQMTVADGGDGLVIRYGPLPLFRKKIPYASIRSAEPGRSAFIDGWGIHYIPKRGWTYNLWGYSCVVLIVDGKPLRVGSPDAENLAMFLKSKIVPGSA
jgi:hypothetical protein